jgi:hypothetical protein
MTTEEPNTSAFWFVAITIAIVAAGAAFYLSPP